MDDKERMASLEEHLISIPDNPSGSGERVSTETDEEDSSLPSTRDVDEKWITEVENKIDQAFMDAQWPRPLEDKTEPKICKFKLHEEISRPRLVTVGEFSQPRVATIGPFHLQDTARISNNTKWMIVCFMNLLYSLHLPSCLKKIENQVANARKCHFSLDIPQSFDSEDDKSFAEMLLLDSYFILFMLTIKIRKMPTGYTLMPITPNPTMILSLFRDDTTKDLDIIFNKDEIAPDLLILDNQIPFLVIEVLFEELKLEKPLHKYVLEFFETIHPKSVQGSIDENNLPKFLHLLDLFYWSRVPNNKYIEPESTPQQPDSIDQAHDSPNLTELIEESATMSEEKKQQPQQTYSIDRPAQRILNLMFEKKQHLLSKIKKKKQPQQPNSIKWARHIPNAMELRESATMFEKKTSGSSLVITLRKHRFTTIIRVLAIPELHIRDYSSLIFYNLIAFEMQSSSRRCTMVFSTLMRKLLQSEEDVKLLRRRGILASSSITDSELVNLFESLSKLTENHELPGDLCGICYQVMSYHNHPVNRFCGNVILQYFPNPLVTISVFTVVVVFVLTLLQTIYTMISYYHHP